MAFCSSCQFVGVPVTLLVRHHLLFLRCPARQPCLVPRWIPLRQAGWALHLLPGARPPAYVLPLSFDGLSLLLVRSQCSTLRRFGSFHHPSAWANGASMAELGMAVGLWLLVWLLLFSSLWLLLFLLLMSFSLEVVLGSLSGGLRSKCLNDSVIPSSPKLCKG